MSFSIVTGKLGSGKTSFAVSQALSYLKKNRRVAANFSLDFTSFPEVHPDAYVTILPDVPHASDFLALGRGGPSEHEAGLIIIDEGAFCLNSRGWADKDRQNLIEFFALTRKLGWDVILIIQHIQALDKQVRLLFGETLVICQRLDKLKLMGIFKMPKIHLAVSRYGTDANSPISDRSFYRPSTIGRAYDTNKLFDGDSETFPYCTLTRRLAVLRYLPPRVSFRRRIFQLALFVVQCLMALVLILWARSARMDVIQSRVRSSNV
ncbi:zonular occludens toxin domain-containing protein [Chromobacterium violaceum]|uniref:zonular occludens toxin domain-containing protein n=1 Tax=Chromobacterium violaceum TaxID=536 RepID=UPI00194EFA0B|nr:zonular occludens toxin domain-containing protein [Chromobacterium violaceum]QRO33896.1 hypothetical protein I6K04_03910 [Chromobacterium violaceum]QRQ16300.1 hypothetical protein I6K03_18820 [Chromobacterium violaceum]